MSDQYAELRRLGPLEKYSYVRSELGIYHNVCVTTNLTRRTSEALRPALIRALASVVAKHPILSAVPVGDLKSPRFVRLPSINADQVLVIDEAAQSNGDLRDDELLAASWDQIVRDQHNTPFKHTTPLEPFWRIYVRPNVGVDTGFSLCLCFHHALLDTQSGLVFLQDLENALSHPTNEQLLVANIIPTSTEALLPSMESLHEFPMSPEFLAKQQTAAPQSDNVWSGPLQTLPVETQFKSAWLSQATTNRLVAVARKEQTSVTGILMSTLAQACFRVITAEFSEINGDCAVSLRQFLPEPITPESMGSYAGSFGQRYTISMDLWEDARKTKQLVRELVGNSALDVSSTYLKHVEDMEAWFTKKIGTKRASAWEISNVGLLGPWKEGQTGIGKGYRLNSLLFSQSSSACAGAVKISVATGRDGRLSLGFTWQAGVVRDEFVKQFMENVHEILGDAARTGETHESHARRHSRDNPQDKQKTNH